jgi:hypothetical protein
MPRHVAPLAALVALLPVLSLAAPPEGKEAILFDFEQATAADGWSSLESSEKEPAVKVARVAGAAAGTHGLGLTFAGGRWPTATTTRVLDDWTAYTAFEADVTASRPCVVGFAALQEKSRRGGDWDALVSRWTKTAFLKAGTNHVVGTVPGANDYAIHRKWGKVVRFEVFMYRPRDGESIRVENVRLTGARVPPRPRTEFTVAGTDVKLSGGSSADAAIELGKRLKDRWAPPQARTLEEVEAGFRDLYVGLKKSHPRAVLAVLRDGEMGFDPADPGKAYAGWKDAYWTSHGPDSNFAERARNRGGSASHEVFMRHRSPLMRVDLSSIPKGSAVLAARLVVVRANDKYLDDHNPEKKPTMWVVEPCNRPWEELEVNAFEYAGDKFWKEVGGMHWGEDPDFHPVFLAHGPGQGKVNAWDFAEAVRYWTDGEHPNHGFMLHGDSHDYLVAHTREAERVRDRPAVLVIYEPK